MSSTRESTKTMLAKAILRHAQSAGPDEHGSVETRHQKHRAEPNGSRRRRRLMDIVDGRQTCGDTQPGIRLNRSKLHRRVKQRHGVHFCLFLDFSICRKPGGCQRAELSRKAMAAQGVYGSFDPSGHDRMKPVRRHAMPPHLAAYAEVECRPSRSGRTPPKYSSLEFRAPLKIPISSLRRKPESRNINHLDTGFRRCDGFLEAPLIRTWNVFPGCGCTARSL
jgi:hypothetical protein